MGADGQHSSAPGSAPRPQWWLSTQTATKMVSQGSGMELWWKPGLETTIQIHEHNLPCPQTGHDGHCSNPGLEQQVPGRGRAEQRQSLGKEPLSSFSR